MGLKSRIFKGDPVFEACLVRDDAHITPGAVGKHVSKIHTALFRLDHLDVSDDERKQRRYGVPGEPGDPAYTTLGGYYYGMDEIELLSDEYERAIYITPEFLNKVFAASVLIHELAHYCGGREGTADTIEHRASPLPPPRGKRLKQGLHDYAGMTADEAYRNAQSYQCYCFPNSFGKPPGTL